MYGLKSVVVVALCFGWSGGFSDDYDDSWLDAMIYGGEEVSEKELPVWNGELSLDTGYGYRENVFLSELAEEDAGFAYLGIESIAVRKSSNERTEFMGMAYGESRMFEGLDSFDDETFAFVQGHGSHVFSDRVSLGAGIDGLYFKQAFDTTFDELEPLSQIVEGRQLLGSIDGAFDLGVLKPKLKFSNGSMSFDESAGNYDLTRWTLSHAHPLPDKWKLSWSFDYKDKRYDERLERTLEGQSIDDRLLRTSLSTVSLSLSRPWKFQEARGSWKIFTQYGKQRDATFGYYDRKRSKSGVSVDSSWKKWSWDLAVSTLDQSYVNRIGLDGDSRSDSELTWALMVERKLNRQWNLFVAIDGANNEANEELSSYESRTASLGARFSGSK